MKIVIVGGSGRIGARLARNLRRDHLHIFEASRRFNVDTVTGVGLDEILADAEVVIDVSNAPSLEGLGALNFFETSGRNLVGAARRAGVRHLVALSIVGVDGLVAGDYFRAKKIQEQLIVESGIPFTIVRSTQFFEFIRDVVQDGTALEIPIAPVYVQPIRGEDIADTLADLVFTDPFDGVVEIAGPERLRLDEVATEIATAFEDNRRVVADIRAPYFGLELGERSLLPGPDARIAELRFDDWLRESLQPQRLSFPPIAVPSR